MALASYYDGVKLINTRRLKAKESNRGEAMKAELEKLNIKVDVYDNEIVVHKGELKYLEVLDSHDDHRIVMALVPLLTKLGGTIKNVEAINKSYKEYFDVLRRYEVC